jgi:hypothetical protein
MQHAFPQCIPCNVLTVSTFISNLSRFLMVPMVLLTHAFSCKDYKSPLTSIHFLSILFRFFFPEYYHAWVAMAYKNHSKLFAYHYDNGIFSEGILTKLLHTLCHIGMNIFIHVLVDSTLFLIFTSSIVLHGAPKFPSTIFQQQPSCIFPLLEVIYHW